MPSKFKCADCGSESYQFHTGPEGERFFSMICLDCGYEEVLDDATRFALERKYNASDGNTS